MRLTDLLHRQNGSTIKRLAEKSAFVAMIGTDGKVKLSHARHQTIHMNNRDELQAFISDHGLDRFNVLIVDMVNTRGEPLNEL